LNGYNDVKVMPSFVSPFDWRAIINEPDMYIINDFQVMSIGFGEFHFYPKEHNELIEKSKDALIVRQFQEFSMFPYAKVENNKVTWFDLRLTSDGNTGLQAVVEFDDEGNIISSGIDSF
jgi:hypothetical protein